jgi:hypothetical protein
MGTCGCGICTETSVRGSSRDGCKFIVSYLLDPTTVYSLLPLFCVMLCLTDQVSLSSGCVPRTRLLAFTCAWTMVASEASPNILSWKCQVLKVSSASMSLINACSSPRSCVSVVHLLRYILLSFTYLLA